MFSSHAIAPPGRETERGQKVMTDLGACFLQGDGHAALGAGDDVCLGETLERARRRVEGTGRTPRVEQVSQSVLLSGHCTRARQRRTGLHPIYNETFSLLAHTASHRNKS